MAATNSPTTQITQMLFSTKDIKNTNRRVIMKLLNLIKIGEGVPSCQRVEKKLPLGQKSEEDNFLCKQDWTRAIQAADL